MNNQYYSILTDIGKAQLTNAILQDTKLKLTTIKVGDGGQDSGAEVFPTEQTRHLTRERWHGKINHLYQDEKNPLWVVIEAEIPATEGGWCITEFGLFDEQNNLISVGKYPKTYKPKLEEGSGSSLYLKVIIEVANAKHIELKIDPSVTLASREYVDKQQEENLHLFKKMIPRIALTQNQALHYPSKIVINNEKEKKQNFSKSVVGLNVPSEVTPSLFQSIDSAPENRSEQEITVLKEIEKDIQEQFPDFAILKDNHYKSSFNIIKLNWDKLEIHRNRWLAFMTSAQSDYGHIAVPQNLYSTVGAFVKVLSGDISHMHWANGWKHQKWCFCTTHLKPVNRFGSYTHTHPLRLSTKGQVLLALPAVVTGFIDHPSDWFPVASLESIFN
ncbi:phage tail protein [Zooshikella marina]|uniref:phage tail protein n=1 Tax=Zooshikella ganghwensis TaxID=202772 RepID=UPI001BB07A90|nr:phage tail protein [Zooshikella ganghwensis]MBU2707392.1 phage tail protein [Zooshikella ganghwensis]